MREFQLATLAELHKKIDLLENQKRTLKTKLREQMAPQCCCKELHHEHIQKEAHLDALAEHWRGKTQLLVSKFYKALQVVREDQGRVRLSTVDAIQ